MAGRTSPPAPSVEHLPTIFRRIRLGEIGVPAFQRQFLWEPGQVVSLFESVYKGFPIGSLLLWKVDRRILRIAPSDVTAFPTQGEKYPSYFLLDGLQRLTSLYGACFFGESNNKIELDIAFDLENERFVHAPTSVVSDSFLPLSIVFQPREFLEFQRNLITGGAKDLHLSRAIELHQRIQEYMVPIVTISNEEVSEVVQIFERINSTGVKLSTVDFMRAITWSEEFDLNEELDRISRPLYDDGFAVDDETLIKCLGLAFDLDPLPQSLLSLREKAKQQLKAALDDLGVALIRMKAFFREELGLQTSRLVPYEAHIILIVNLYLKTDALSDPATRRVKSWIRTSSWNEELTGRPDHQVARTIRDVTQEVLFGAEDWRGRLYVTRDEIRGKRLITGKAMSTAFAEMMASQGVYSLSSGNLIDSSKYLFDLTTPNVTSIFSSIQVGRALGKRIFSSKVFSNIIIVEDDELHVGVGRDVAGWLADRIGRTIETSAAMRSQFIDVYAAEAILKGDVDSFLSRRAELILEAARRYTN